jgi:ribosomal protein S27AE
MYGEKREELLTKVCPTCGKAVILRVDKEDLERHLSDCVFVQIAFADRNGVPYLDSAEREMMISGLCDDCWSILAPSNPMVYN